MSKEKTPSLLRYAVFPAILPRLLAFVSTTFSFSAYSVACIFYSVRLLPFNHAYVNAANIGKFGLRHVLVAAGGNIKWSWRTADQVVIYFLILIGIALLLSQFVLMGVAVVAQQPAVAGLVEDLFVRDQTQHSQDLVMVIMDRIFGVSRIFESCISVANTACTDMYGNETLDYGDSFPFPFHQALHSMLGFYSNGVFVVAVFVILYFVVVIISETAASGSPFGQRYNKTWIPMRILLFLRC